MKSNVDLVLVASAVDGDEGAIEILLTQYQPSIVRFAHKSCAVSDIEDAVQETFSTIYKKITMLRSTQAFVSWVFQIVRHHCYRLLTLQHTSLLRVNLLEVVAQSSNDSDLAQDLRLDVAAALKRVPLAYRQVLLLRDLEGYSLAEVAAFVNLSEEATKSRLHRGRKIMRDMLAEWVA